MFLRMSVWLLAEKNFRKKRDIVIDVHSLYFVGDDDDDDDDDSVNKS